MDEMADKKCPWCGGQFERGFTSGTGRSRLMIWIEGEARRAGFLSAVAPSSRRMYRIEAYRCKGCGYVAEFASTQWTLASKE
jgi:hypothetical protein